MSFCSIPVCSSRVLLTSAVTVRSPSRSLGSKVFLALPVALSLGAEAGKWFGLLCSWLPFPVLLSGTCLSSVTASCQLTLRLAGVTAPAPSPGAGSPFRFAPPWAVSSSGVALRSISFSRRLVLFVSCFSVRSSLTSWRAGVAASLFARFDGDGVSLSALDGVLLRLLASLCVCCFTFIFTDTCIGLKSSAATCGRQGLVSEERSRLRAFALLYLARSSMNFLPDAGISLWYFSL